MLTPEQQAIRRTGICASEIAAVAGLNPHRTAFDIYAAKVGITEPDEGNEFTRWGHDAEPALIGWYAREHKKTVRSGETIVWNENHLVIATPDGFIDGGGVLECKAPQRTGHDWGDPGTDQIPKYYYPQVTWQMGACGVNEAVVVALLWGRPTVYHVYFSEPLFQRLVEVAMDFWREHVEKQVAPEVDGSTSAKQYIKELYPKSTGELIDVVDVGTEKLVEQLKEARQQRDKLDEQVDAIENRLKSIIKEYDGIKGKFGQITWKSTKDSVRVDYKALVEHLNPDKETIAKFTKVQPGSRRFLVRLAKE